MEQNDIDGEIAGRTGQPTPKLEGYNIKIQAEQLPLYSGSVDYWRIPTSYWTSVLDRIKGMGFRFISLTIPWNIHEVASDLFDFGTTNKQRDLEGFLGLCQERNLFAIVRPGPCVNAELVYYGFPKRILYDKDIQAVSAFGTRVVVPAIPTPFPMPSYASEKFYDEVSKYFDALCPILARNLSPGGPIVGVQIDNDVPLLFRNGPFSADYSSSAIRWYHEFLAGKYPSITALNRAYRTRYNAFEDIEPPRALATTEREALPRYLDWMEFKEYYVGLALSVLASLLWSRGVRGIFTYHNSRSNFPTLPLNVSRTERELDIQGVGLYLDKSQYEEIRRGALYMSTVSRFPFLSEVGIGTWPGGPVIPIQDSQFALLVALMNGVRGFNAHMLVERNRWIGGPLSPSGSTRDQPYAFLHRLLTILDTIEFPTLQRNIPVLLLRNFEYERLYGLCQNGNWFTDLLDIPAELLLDNRTFSYTETIQKAYPDLWNAFYWGLTRSKIPFAIGDTEMDRPALSHYQAIFLPTFDFMSGELQEKIVEYIQRGGTAIIGPELPYLGVDMRGCTILSDQTGVQVPNTRRPLVGFHDPFQIIEDRVRVGNQTAGRIQPHGNGYIIFLGITLPPTTDREGAVDAECVITQSVNHLKIQAEGDIQNPSVDEIYWGTRAPRVIFQANTTNQPQSVRVNIAQRAQLRNLWTGEQLTQRGPQEIALDPYETLLLEVIR
ncbi:MAG: beta-galactosidase [Candidatus Hodarchaeota archaeon]